MQINTQFSKDEQIDNKHMGKHVEYTNNGENANQNTIMYHITPIRMATIKKKIYK